MTYRMAIEELKELEGCTLMPDVLRPSIQAVIETLEMDGTEIHHARWVAHELKELSDKGYVKCSRCKSGFQRYVRGIRHSELPWIDGQPYELHAIDNYCPNCGAKMLNEDEE